VNRTILIAAVCAGLLFCGAIGLGASARASHGKPQMLGHPVSGQGRSARGPAVKTFRLPRVGDPWDTAIDRAGSIWFTEPSCDISPACPAGTPPGRIGELRPSSGRVRFYRLPKIPGNQPAFLVFDGFRHLWFTTPNNSRIGEFDTARRRFIGQWRVARGSGPWDLTVARGKLWYTDHWGSAVSAFNVSTHTHHDFRTPSANANPYGIAADGGRVWFTENNSVVDRIAAIDTSSGRISEYPIELPPNGTPHMITIGPRGDPWWTEGFSDTIATLDPAVATPGRCGVPAGLCNGVRRFLVPSSSTCGPLRHVSSIIFQPSRRRFWLSDSLSAEVGSFDPADGRFAMVRLRNCLAHPHDGLSVSGDGHVWFAEEFGNAIGELIP
jgi:streptogramin lyase